MAEQDKSGRRTRRSYPHYGQVVAGPSGLAKWSGLTSSARSKRPRAKHQKKPFRYPPAGRCRNDNRVYPLGGR